MENAGGEWIIDNAEKSRLVEFMGRVRECRQMEGVKLRAMSRKRRSAFPTPIDGWRTWLEAWVAYAGKAS
jgi:hypothetical protein